MILAVVAIVILVTPYNATTVRRLNDTGMSAWWLPLTWTPLVGLAFMVYLGTKTPLSPQPVEAADEPPASDPSRVAVSAQTPADDTPRTRLKFAVLGAAMVVGLCVVDVNGRRIAPLKFP